MKRFKKLISLGAGAIVTTSTLLTISLGTASANPPCYQYNPNGFPTSQTPVFNNICGITSTLSSTQGSYPLGDEPNFVRIRPHASDNPLGSANPPLVDKLSSACSAGNKFDIWTYVHNDAEPQFNNNGTGTAVAHNVQLALDAKQLNITGNNFTFSSTVSASNAPTVSDNTTLDCNGQPVKLTLVANAVHYNNDLNQTTFGNMPDSAVNGVTKLGSPVWQSGEVWGCWNYRVVVVYTVEVQPVTPPPQASAQCTFLGVLASSDRTVKINQFTFTNTNATFKNAVINWGDNSSETVSDSKAVIGKNHQYADFGQFVISALVTFSVPGQTDITSGGPNSLCAQTVSFSPNTPPTVTPPPTTPGIVTPPTQLVNTGAGSVIGIFAAVTAAGTIGYRWLTARRLSRQ